MSWRQLAVAAAVIVAVGAGAAAMFKLGGGGGSSALPRLAILPFENQGDSTDAYFADGIVDEVRGKLARLGNMSVIASTSASQYRGSPKPATEIARELSVDYLLVGRVRWLENADGVRRVQVVGELVDGNTGATTWQETFDGRLTDVFQMQATMATRVANALGTALGTNDQEHLAERPTSNAAAYDLYLKGRAILDNGTAPQRQAAGYYEQAVALDAGFAEAWAGLGTALGNVYANGTRDVAVARRAAEAIARARELAPNSGVTNVAASRYHYLVRGDYDSAKAAVDRAIALEPNNAEVLASAGLLDAAFQRSDSAVTRLERARDLDPRSPRVLAALLGSLVQVEQFERAKQVGHDVVALTPADMQSTQLLVDSYVGSQDLEGARAVIRRALIDVPSTQVVTYFAGYNEMMWLFDQREVDLLFRLTPAAFDNDVAWWGQSLSIAAHQRGDLVRARAYADSSLAESQAQARANPRDTQLGILYGLMLAYAGQVDAAITEMHRVKSQDTQSSSFNTTYMMLQAARIEIAAGRFDEAIATLAGSRRLLYPSKGRLRFDPTFDPLRGKAGFEALLK